MEFPLNTFEDRAKVVSKILKKHGITVRKNKYGELFVNGWDAFEQAEKILSADLIDFDQDEERGFIFIDDESWDQRSEDILKMIIGREFGGEYDDHLEAKIEVDDSERAVSDVFTWEELSELARKFNLDPNEVVKDRGDEFIIYIPKDEDLNTPDSESFVGFINEIENRGGDMRYEGDFAVLDWKRDRSRYGG